MDILTSPLQLKQFYSDLERTELRRSTSATGGLTAWNFMVSVTSLLLTSCCALQPCIPHHTPISAPTHFCVFWCHLPGVSILFFSTRVQSDCISVSHSEWLISAYSCSALLIKSLSRCVAKSMRLTEDGINRCGNACEQKLICDLVCTVVVHKSWLIKVILQNMMHNKYDKFMTLKYLSGNFCNRAVIFKISRFCPTHTVNKSMCFT
jgi:hypothetical protein